MSNLGITPEGMANEAEGSGGRKAQIMMRGTCSRWITATLQSRLGALAIASLIFLLISLLTRIILTVAARDLIAPTAGKIALILTVGFAYDVITLSYLALPLALVLLLLPDKWTRSWWLRGAALVGYFLALFLLIFNACAEWLFWQEFGSRYNFVAVDYLVYTTEVITNIRESYPVTTILVSVGALAAAILAATWRPFLRALSRPTRWKSGLITVSAIGIIAAGAFLFIDDDDFRLFGNYYANELSHNGIYNLVDAYEDNALDFDQYYLTQDLSSVFSHLRPLVKDANARYVNPAALDLRRHVTAQGEERHLNVVLIVIESLSADFLGVFGNKAHLTPNLDALAHESLFFDNTYATGTRTDRGLEAITLSIPPTPGRSVIKRPDNGNMYTLMHQFKRRGYDTRFIYGGYGYFDNMNKFFAGNGAEIIDRTVLTRGEVTFTNAWGVCDGDLYRRTLKECDGSFAKGHPFFSLVLTTSNHRPFTYPQTIDILSGTGRNGAVKYTDQALGEFLQAARSRPWFNATVFVIVADHCAGSAGEAEINYAKYHIPLFFYAPSWIAPQRVHTLASQIDIAPTLLGRLNFSYESLFFGRDIMLSPPQRVMVGNYQKLGYADGHHLIVLLPQKKTVTYLIEDGKNTREVATDPKLLEEAIAYYQGANYLLAHKLYHP